MSDHHTDQPGVGLKFQRALLPGVHRLVHVAFEKAGYHWELHRRGEEAIGAWRIRFGAKNKRKPGEKRFVLIPGFGDTAVSWLGVLTLLQPVLRKRFDEVVLLDFPGFRGFQAGSRCFASMDLLLDATHDVLERLKPSAILGHSLGGWVAGSYAAKYSGPELLVLANPSGVFGTEGDRAEFQGIFRQAISEGFGALRGRLFAREPFWFRFLSGGLGGFIQRPDTVQFMESIREDHALEDKLSAINSKVWLLWGREDTLVPSRWAAHWLKGLEQKEERARAVFLRGVGHIPQIESPALTALVLGQILLGRTPAKAGARYWELS